MPEGLKLTVGADIKDAEQALKRFDSLMNETGSEAKKLGVTFGKAFGRAPLQDIGNLNKAFSSFKANAGNFRLTAIGDQFSDSLRNANNQLQRLPNTSNAATQSLINLSRVAQDAPFGFLGIANNLNPLLESFQRLRAQSGSAGSALKALGSSLLGAGGIGLALGVVSSLLVVFGKDLFGAGAAADDSKDRLDALSDSIKDVADNVGNLSSRLDFLNQLGSINVQIRGEGNLQDLIEQSVAQRQLVFDIGGQILKAQENLNAARLENQRQSSEESQKVEDDAVKALQDVTKKQEDARDKSTILFRQIAFQKIKDQQDANEKEKQAQRDNLENLKKYIEDAKRLASELEKIGFVAPATFSFFDTQTEQLQKARKVFADFNSNNIKIDTKKLGAQFPLQITEPPPEKVAEALTATEELVKRGLINFPAVEVDIIFTAQEERNAEIISDFRKRFEALGATLKLPEGALQDPALFNKLNNQFENLKSNIDFANASANVLSNTFTNLISRISRGESPIKAFFESLGQSILQLITQLIAAAIRAAIFKAILAGSTGGASSFLGKLLGGGSPPGLAQGGIVSGPTLALVGEGVGTSRSNPEVIAPLDQLKGMLSGMTGSSPQVVIINSRVRGNNLDLVLNRQQRQNRRLGSA
jgi:archaellum component FlaC